MPEYASTIELWIEANNDEQAQEIVDIASTMVRAVPGVVQIETELPEVTLMPETQEQYDAEKLALETLIESQEFANECENANYHSIIPWLAEYLNYLCVHKWEDIATYEEDEYIEQECQKCSQIREIHRDG